VNFREERVFEFRNTLLTYESDLQFKKNQLVNQSNIVSPYSGTIVDLSFNSGDIFKEGSTFLIIENDDYQSDQIVALAYVNANEGKKIRPGMKVQVAPSTIPPEEYGYMVGTVEYISKYTLTQAGMNRVLRNEKVVEEFSKEGLPMVVQIKMEHDSTTFSRYKWTTRKGPASEILSGTLMQAKVIAEEKKPISFILPFL
jgi:HlyD family secretion protein